MTTTVTDVAAIPAIGHHEAMALAAVESGLLLDVVDALAGADWGRPTDCGGWDVTALLSHVLGGMEGNARVLEFVRQYRGATSAAKRGGASMIDEMTAMQVRDHAGLTPGDLAASLHEVAPRAVRGRRRMPALMRAVPFRPGPPFPGTWKLGYLVGTIMNRDLWMHRVDLTRATGAPLVLTPDHDGRIVADIVAEWARAHGQPFALTLDGPAGGSFVHGARGEDLHLDAVEFCRTLSGRASGGGLLDQEVPF